MNQNLYKGIRLKMNRKESAIIVNHCDFGDETNDAEKMEHEFFATYLFFHHIGT
jgi:hypothetical protein